MIRKVEINELSIKPWIGNIYFKVTVPINCECGRRIDTIDRRRLYTSPLSFSCDPVKHAPHIKFCNRKFSVALTKEQIKKEKAMWAEIKLAQIMLEQVSSYFPF